MIYMSPQSKDITHYPSAQWGQIATPRNWNKRITPNKLWCADNDVFNGHFSEGVFFPWLERMRAYQDRCVFVVCPDVVADPIGTRTCFEQYAPAIRALGYPVAFAAQDGQERLSWPADFDAVFIGGSTEWKLSPQADVCIAQVRAMGKWVHVGRVNSQKRIRHFQLVGVDSVDGTGITFAPDREFVRLHKQLVQKPLFIHSF